MCVCVFTNLNYSIRITNTASIHCINIPHKMRILIATNRKTSTLNRGCVISYAGVNQYFVMDAHETHMYRVWVCMWDRQTDRQTKKKIPRTLIKWKSTKRILSAELIEMIKCGVHFAHTTGTRIQLHNKLRQKLINYRQWIPSISLTSLNRTYRKLMHSWWSHNKQCHRNVNDMLRVW